MGLEPTYVLNHGLVKALLNQRSHALRKYQQVVVEEVSKLVGDGGVVVAELPTGYGKTLIPVALAASLVTDNLVSRVIHTYPATSMIEHLLRKNNSEVEALKRAWLNALGVGERASKLLVGARHMFRHESPLLTNPYVITTLDTLVAHYLKTSFAKLSKASGRGMYSEFSVGVIHSSLLVFDEAHMYPVTTEEGTVPTLGKAFNVMAHIMGKHAEVGGVSLLMTATLPEPLLLGLKEILARYGVVPRIIKYVKGEDDPPSKEGSFLNYDRRRSYDVELREVRGREELIKELSQQVTQLAKEGRRVLAVLNTVGDAVKTYLKVKEGLSSGNIPVVLAHSRFTLRDREAIVNAVDEAARSEGGSVVVATQVVEASIDVSMDALLTDVAPLDSMAQRLGRVCRPGHFSGECEGKVTVFAVKNELRSSESGGKENYGPYDNALVSESLSILREVLGEGRESVFKEFAVTPSKYVSEAYGRTYAPVLLPNDELLDFLEGITVRTSPALIEDWVHEEFGGFVRDEDLTVAVLVNRGLINAYLQNREEDELKDGVLRAVKDNLMVKARLGTLTEVLRKAGIRKVPLAHLGLNDVALRDADLDKDFWLIRAASRGGAYVIIPEDLYSSELGLTNLGGGG